MSTSDGAGFGTLYAYAAYGEPAYDNWGGARFRYTGQMMLPEAKLYHYKARVYDPILGRFLQTDPIGYQADLNLQAYVGNDPVNKTDPTGLAQVCVETTGSRIHSCVSVDGNGDGSTADNDLTKSQIADLQRDFRGFIQNNNGKDLSKNGLSATNMGATSEAVNLVRAVSQFVGTARGGWTDGEWRLTVGTKQAFVANGKVVAPGPAWNLPLEADGKRVGSSLYFAVEYEGILRPSNLSRAFIHETLHANPKGYETIPFFGHDFLDARARRLNVRYGFGKCDAMAGFGGC